MGEFISASYLTIKKNTFLAIKFQLLSLFLQINLFDFSLYLTKLQKMSLCRTKIEQNLCWSKNNEFHQN
jgi:hypothetical protein